MRDAKIYFRQIRPILKSIEDDGIDVRGVLLKRGLAQTLDQVDDTATLSIVDYFRIQKDIALVSDDLTAHYSQRKLTFRTGHFVMAQLQQANTLVSAMESLVDHFNMMHGEAYNSVRVSGERIKLIINDSAFPYTFDGDPEVLFFVGDCLLIKIHCLLDSLSDGLAEEALVRVRLQRTKDAAGAHQVHFWDVPLDHSWPTYELVYDLDLASRMFPAAARVDMSTDGIFNRVIEHLETHLPTSAPTIAERTLALIEDGYVRQDEVSRLLEMSVATHRRRLEDAGLSFRDLVKETRLTRAEALLKRGLSVPQVADALDYSDVRAFNRAFKSWKGVTPAAFARSMTGIA